MATISSSTVSSYVFQPLTMPPESSAGALDVFPGDVLVNILKFVSNPLQLPPICKKINRMVRPICIMQLEEGGDFLKPSRSDLQSFFR